MNCKTCNQPLVEYVGFNSLPGDENNPWDCTNDSCGVETKETNPGLSGLVEFPPDWDVSWTALRERIEECANLNSLLKPRVIVGKFFDDGMRTFVGYDTINLVRVAVSGLRLVAAYPIPTRNAPSQTASVVPATQASSPTQRTPAYPVPGLTSKADAIRLLNQGLASGRALRYSNQPQESDLPQKSGTPTKAPNQKPPIK